MHADDDAEGGRDEWRRRISEALTGTTFFIPIIIPRYFRSEECRRELVTFAGHARSLGVTELLLPIVYAEAANLDENSDDEAVALYCADAVRELVGASADG